MAIIRTPNHQGGGDERTHQIGDGAPNHDPYSEKTVVAKPHSYAPTISNPAPSHTEEERTRLVGAQASGKSVSASNFLDDPVVGWLVIIDGPGKGQALKIGYGQNSVGRAAGQRIQLDFGDDQISREGHAFITYDPKGRKFYVQNGGGSNLIYAGNDPILVPTELGGVMDLSLGKTVVRFVPFCGSGFDWQAQGDAKA